MPTSQKVSALLVVALAALGALYTLVVGNEPLLGLDLQGGVSVVLEPTGTADGADEGAGREVTEEALDLTVELLRSRIDQIGVAEPEISRQGENIVVGLPGLVEEQEEALDRLRQTAELRFRPVLAGPEQLGVSLDAEATEAEPDDTDGTDGDEADTSDADTEDTSETDTSETDTEDSDEENSLGVTGRLSPVQVIPANTTDSTDATDDADADAEPAADAETDADATDDADADDAEADTGADAETDESETDAESESETVEPVPLDVDNPLLACVGDDTAEEDDLIDEIVVLTDEDGGRYCLGPAVLDGELLTGDMIETADVGLSPQGGWLVSPTFNEGEAGIDRFNQVAAVCFLQVADLCPTSRLAVVLDHQVISAPNILDSAFGRNSIQITGDFTEDEARRLAEALRFGSLPLELVAQETRTVSATIGQDVLRSGVIAGLIGLALVAVYLLYYYRLAGLVAISGLLLSAAMLWTIIAWFGETFGLALSLAGVVGLIVAIGVSADSNIVYFENVKDSVRSGRRIPTAVERAYESAISTIVKADVVSLIAAVLLYFLTVGAVRGFAFYLGLATILDLIISWMFMRPALSWLARKDAVEKNPRLLGLPETGVTS